MIVKILSSARSFKGVQYNTDKVENNMAELIKVANFGPLQALDRVRPEDYRNYLKLVSSQNRNTKKPQFHAMISAKGREHTKEELAEIAEKWLAKMGYAQQPYLMVFHKDTRNNHVHIVSSRIDKEGAKISSAFEKNRAIQHLNQVMGLDEQYQANVDFEKALTYSFTTKTQFNMLLESRGYVVKSDKNKLQLIKFGKVVAEFDADLLNLRVAEIKANAENLKSRIQQLSAIFNKYLEIHSSALYPVMQPLAGGREKALSVFTCDFAEYLKMKLGVELIFHSKYAYSILDHDGKNVFKGGQVMDLKTMLSQEVLSPILETTDVLLRSTSSISRSDQPEQSIVSANFRGDHPINTKGSNPAPYYGNTGKVPELFKLNGTAPASRQGVEGTMSPIIDKELPRMVLYSPKQTVAPDDGDSLQEYGHQAAITINLADDIDDEAVLGMKRRKKGMARTNTR